MKSKDVSLLLVVGVVSAVIAIVLSNLFFASDKNRNIQVEVVEPISGNFSTPSNKYFNETSVNPTYDITIGQSTNDAPFKKSDSN